MLKDELSGIVGAVFPSCQRYLDFIFVQKALDLPVLRYREMAASTPCLLSFLEPTKIDETSVHE